jgi:sarcosine oxidase subunit beta
VSGRYDVVVVGAGSVGTPAAAALAEAGLRTLVVDGAASVGQGANKAAIGGVRATHSDRGKIALCLRSLKVLSTWRERHGHDIEWHQGGYCFVAYGEREERTLRELLAAQHAFGLDIRWRDRDALLEAVPSLEPEGLIGGTLSPGDGSASPLLTALAFLDVARERGAEFRFRERVTAIDVAGGAVTRVRTDKGEYPTDCVVNAAGAEAAAIARMAGTEAPVRPDCHEGGITEPVARFMEPMVVDIRPAEGSANFYFYQHATGQVVFCITPSPPIWGEDRRSTSGFLPMVSRRMVSVMPRLAALRVRRVWRGLYPMTPDGLPIVGTVDGVEGYVNAVGMCGQGFMLGPGLAEHLCKLVTGRLSTEERSVLSGFSPSRPFAGGERLK